MHAGKTTGRVQVVLTSLPQSLLSLLTRLRVCFLMFYVVHNAHKRNIIALVLILYGLEGDANQAVRQDIAQTHNTLHRRIQSSAFYRLIYEVMYSPCFMARLLHTV